MSSFNINYATTTELLNIIPIGSTKIQGNYQLLIDSVIIPSNTTILIKNQTNTLFNGLFKVLINNTNFFELIRILSSEININSRTFYITDGNINKNKVFLLNFDEILNGLNNQTIKFGVIPITFTQLIEVQTQLSAQFPIQILSNTISLDQTYIQNKLTTNSSLILNEITNNLSVNTSLIQNKLNVTFPLILNNTTNNLSLNQTFIQNKLITNSSLILNEITNNLSVNTSVIQNKLNVTFPLILNNATNNLSFNLSSLTEFGFFGDGSSGDLSITSGTTFLGGDSYFNSVKIDSTGILNTNRWRLFVRDTLVNEGLITVSGGDAIGFNGGTSYTSQMLGGGGTGGSGGTTTGGNQVSTGVITNQQLGNRGGNGGNGISGVGGTSPARTPNLPITGGLNILSALPYAITGRTATASQLSGGFGGGGGGGNGTQRGGGGGGGAAGMIISARNILGTGSIKAIGGNGAIGLGLNCGGGGGGGGGWIGICSSNNSFLSTMTISVLGGNGANANGPSSTAGQAGSNGIFSFLII